MKFHSSLKGFLCKYYSKMINTGYNIIQIKNLKFTFGAPLFEIPTSPVAIL
jgi:hypothetical protein